MKKIIIGTLVVSALMMNTSLAAFKDVPETHWAYTAIEKMQNDGILSGYVDGTFKPNNNISLAEFATIFTKIFELPKDNLSNYFTDISKTHWAKGSIEAIRKYINPYYDSLGETLGFDGYSYMEGITGDLEMTREAFVYAVSKIYGYDESAYVQGEEKILFADADEILFPKETVLAYKNGVINGEIVEGKTYIRPNRHITRAEASAIFRNLLKYDAKRVKNEYQENELVVATSNFMDSLKKGEFENANRFIYDTANVLSNKYFTVSEEEQKMLKEIVKPYFKKFEYEVTETGFDGFNHGYVKLKIKGYDIKELLSEALNKISTDFETDSIYSILKELVEKFSKGVKNREIKATEFEETFNFVYQDGEWKLSL